MEKKVVIFITVIIIHFFSQSLFGQSTKSLIFGGELVFSYYKPDVYYNEAEQIPIDRPRKYKFIPDESLKENNGIDSNKEIIIPLMIYSFFDKYVSRDEVKSINNEINQLLNNTVFVDEDDGIHTRKMLYMVGEFVVIDSTNTTEPILKSFKADFSIHPNEIDGFYILKRIITCWSDNEL